MILRHERLHDPGPNQQARSTCDDRKQIGCYRMQACRARHLAAPSDERTRENEARLSSQQDRWDRDKQGSPRNYAHGGISISSGSRGQWLRQTHRNICWLLANWPTVRRNRVLVKWPRTVIQIRAGEVTINLGRKVDQDYNALHARTESWRPRSECPHIGFGKAASSVRGGLDSPASA